MKQQELQVLFSDPINEIHNKLDKFFWILFSVGFIFVVTLIVMVATLVVDSFHINAATYKEYSQKTETIEVMQKINQEVIEKNIQNQERIIKQQNQIIELLNKINIGS